MVSLSLNLAYEFLDDLSDNSSECIGTIRSCQDIPATVIPYLISANAESFVESAEEFLVDLSDNLSECIGTVWSCPDLPATVIPGLISGNAESAEDFTVDLSDNSSECIGTSLVSVLLPDMVLMASDSRISAIDKSKLLLDPEQKLHTIRAHPPVIASWSHYNKAGKALMDFLKEKASTKNVKDIAELGRVFLKGLPGRFELQCYLCTIENGEPKGYIINRFAECHCGHQCDCSKFRIISRKRGLGRGVYCGGSGAKAAFDVMSEKYRGVEKNRPRTGERNIENLTSSLEFDAGVEYLLFVMVDVALRKKSCGSPFWVSSISNHGDIEEQPSCDFIKGYSKFFDAFKVRYPASVFIIYRRALEGKNFGQVICENFFDMGTVKKWGFTVADLVGEYSLHFMTMHEQEHVSQLVGSFHKIVEVGQFPEVELFSSDVGELKFRHFDMSKLDVEVHGVPSADVRDGETVFIAVPTLSFLGSLKLDPVSISFASSEASGSGRGKMFQPSGVDGSAQL